MISRYFLCDVFSDTFMRFHWVLGVVGYESSLNGIAFSASLWIGFQDLKFVIFSIMDFDSQGLDVDILNRFNPHRKLTWQWKITFFKWLGFPVVISVFVFFVQMIC